MSAADPSTAPSDRKAEGAFRTIGEVSADTGVAPHILRYWEQHFAQLRPVTRAGGRRYYRPGDVALVRRIDRLLNVEGYTLKGARAAVAGGVRTTDPDAPAAAAPSESDAALIAALRRIRDTLAAALADEA